MANEADLVLGAFVPWGRKPELDLPPRLRSEFGVQPISIFLESRVFF